MTDPPWEPPLAGTEAQALVGALDRQRWTFRYKAGGLGADGLAARVGSSSLTLGGLLKHLALMEHTYSGRDLSGTPLPPPFDSEPDDGEPDDGEQAFTSAAGDTPEQLYAQYDDAVRRSRARLAAALADGGLDQRVELGRERGLTVNLRRLVFDLLEEYARHTGHADLLRESVDGVTGEDPPDDWRP